jgi:hypothetical protein
MTAIVGAVIEGVGTLARYSFWSVVGAGALAGGYAFLTKPEDATFKPYFRSLLTQNEGKQTSMAERLLEFGLNVAIEKTSTVEFKDYVFSKQAIVRLPDGQIVKFIGVAQNWYLNE